MTTMTAATLSPLASAHPPSEPDHGVNNSTFHAFWSEDDDLFVNETNYRNLTGDSRSSMEILANGTDIPFDQPPRDVERWNFGELKDFPATNQSISIGPEDVRRTDGRFIKDAYISLFAIQPSTRAWLTPTDEPLYVGEDGAVLAITDYRLDLPPNVSTNRSRDRWWVEEHEVQTNRLLVGGKLVNETGSSHTPTLWFSDLFENPGRTHTLTVESYHNVTVGYERERCLDVNRSATGECANWDSQTEYMIERVIVTDERVVTEHNIPISGYQTRYPDGDLGLALYRLQPWLGFETPAGTVRGSWRFYTARNSTWDTIEARNATHSVPLHSPSHPLQTFAYPIESGSSTSEPTSLELLASYGTSQRVRVPPKNVNLDIPRENYTASFGLAVRIDAAALNQSDESVLEAMRAQGLARGVETNLSDAILATVPMLETNLSLSIEQLDNGTAAVEATLREAESGSPIETAGRDGYLILEGQRVDTGPNGTVSMALQSGSGIVTARYEPADWWAQPPGYVADEAIVSTTDSAINIVNAIYQIGIPVALLLLAAFLVDRITGIPIWPPWRV